MFPRLIPKGFESDRGIALRGGSEGVELGRGSARRAPSSRRRAAGRAALAGCVAAAIASPWLQAEAWAQEPDAVAAQAGASALVKRAFDNLYADDYIQTLQLTTRARGGRGISRRLQVTRKQSTRPSKTLLLC